MFSWGSLNSTGKYLGYMKYPMYVSLPFLWFYIGSYDRQTLKSNMYIKGRNLSQTFKPIPYWDRYAEPIIINQFSNIFAAGNSFIKGLVSDNEDRESVNNSINRYRQDIDEELSEYDHEQNNSVIKLSPMEPIDD